MPHSMKHKASVYFIYAGAFWFARHGRALTGESPEHAQIVGSV